MTGWLQLTDEQRRQTLNQAQQITGVGLKALEKDWWVTLVLKALFHTEYAEHMVFKGGTSLSKGWQLINRFSEDIDIALDCAAFGLVYEENPTKNFRDKLKRQGCIFTSSLLKDALSAQIADLGVAEGRVAIVAKPVPENRPDTDPQTIFVKYISLYDPNPYLPDEVKIEVSVRSLRTPAEIRSIISILSATVPNKAYEEHPFEVLVVRPKKTFLEKAFLLHEEFCKPDRTRIRHERMSRHFSDLVMIADSIGPEALADHELYDQLIANRQAYMRLPHMDYGLLHHTSISFLPPPEVAQAYETDYATMRENMIYGETPAYAELIRKLKILQGKFRMKTSPHGFDWVVAEALQQTAAAQDDTITVTITAVADPEQPVSEHNPVTAYQVTFIREADAYLFEEIVIV